MACVDIRSLFKDELQTQFQDWGEKSYRLTQLLEWLYRRQAESWDEMTNLPKSLRQRLASQFSLNTLKPVRVQGARDATQKVLWQLGDGAFIESVLIPANPALYGDSSDRHTLCVSTQVGCAYGCKFCASGLEGWKRNLRPEEMVGQIIGVERWQRPSGEESRSLARLESSPGPALPVPGEASPRERYVNNLVIMGMGEPLANYDALIRALKILNASWGGGIGARKITVSTSGLVPQIRKLADEPLQFRLAISLHGATDAVRTRIMPVNRKYPLRDLTAACEYYVQKKGKMITLEYILIAGVNDDPDQAKPLASIATRLNAKINLIPYNRVEGLPWVRPSDDVQERFLAALERERVSVTLRREKGHEIDAACGQLRLRTERELRAASEPAMAGPG
jgi:23S rRNA (adenine2503-C2)-methyltransferase